MSDYAGVTPIPKELNLEGWYELVAGDHIPTKWAAWWIFPSGKAQSQIQESGLTNVQSTAWIQDGVRIFTRTPPPSAIKRIRAAETQQEELPTQLLPREERTMPNNSTVIPIPDFLNISDWYELVEGDSTPPEWPVLALYQSGQVKYFLFKAGWTYTQVKSALARSSRLFTRTPPPSAIKRIRTAETKQEELPPAVSNTAVLQRRMNDLEVQFTDLYSELSKLNERLNNYIDGA